MFLVTTADQRSWKTDEDILFLGEWCKIYNERHIWGKLNHDTLPYHFADREKLFQAYQYVDTIYAKQINYLSGKLNEIHNVDQSTRYWKIIIGPWLLRAITILFDRYLSIKSAMESGLVTNTWIDASSTKSKIAKDSIQFENWSCMDQYNHCLYGKIIKELGGISYDAKNIYEKDLYLDDRGYLSQQSDFKKLAKNILFTAQRFFPNRTPKATFISSHIGFWSLARFQLSLGQFPYLFPPNIHAGTFPIKLALREKIKISNAENPFELLLQRIIPEVMPTVYLEGFSKMKQDSLDQFPKKSKIILTAHGGYEDEAFKFWAANQIENGAKLLLLQHGGFYGVSRWNTYENIELDISDNFYTWGWVSKRSKTIPMKSWHLAKRVDKIKPDPNGNILVVGNSIPRYTATLNPQLNGPQLLGYVSEQELFVKSVTGQVRELLIMKPHIIDYGWQIKERWKDFVPHLNIYYGKKNATSLLKKSRLCIQTYNSTGFLETFVMNFPTLLFWNPKYWELRDSAQPYFEEFRRVGMLHDSPESAAAKVNEIYNNPLSWWATPEIQKVKNDFCRQYAWTTRNWQADWKKELLRRAEE